MAGYHITKRCVKIFLAISTLPVQNKEILPEKFPKLLGQVCRLGRTLHLDEDESSTHHWLGPAVISFPIEPHSRLANGNQHRARPIVALVEPLPVYGKNTSNLEH